MFTTAITRLPGPNFAEGLTSVDLGSPEYSLCLDQHAAYRNTLTALGLTLLELKPLADCPDAYFVEDVAVVVPEVAIITCPGASSRQAEPPAVAAALAERFELRTITGSGTLDGGDVLIVDKHCYVGLSQRTNADGAEQLGEHLKPFGYTTTAVPIGASLHLKSDINTLGDDLLIMTPAMATRSEFEQYDRIVVSADESYAANSLRINTSVLTPAGFPETSEQLIERGLLVIELDVSEIQKMDGGLTCLSIRF